MRGRRLVADLVDLARSLPVAVPLALPVFFFAGALGEVSYQLAPRFAGRLDVYLEGLAPLGLALVSLGFAWAFSFVLVRAGIGSTVGELLAGLKPPAGRHSRVKAWLRAIFLIDLPLGWVLPVRPIDRLLGTAAERDHTRTWLEAFGNTLRKKPAVVPVTAASILVMLASLSAWASTMEQHHRRLILSTVSEYDGFCGPQLALPRGRSTVRAAAAAEWLAPETFRSHLVPGTIERHTLDEAVALLDGPCGALQLGQPVPAGGVETVPWQSRRAVLAADLADYTSQCRHYWQYGYNPPAPAGATPCGRFEELPEAFSTRTPGGQTLRCGVYARGGRIAAVLGQCTPLRNPGP